MHLKTWFIFQMEKHCFQRPLLGSWRFPQLPFPGKLVCKWGVGGGGVWKTSLSGIFWNQRLLVLSRKGRATFWISSFLQIPSWEQEGGIVAHTELSHRNCGTEHCEHLETPQEAETMGTYLWLLFWNPSNWFCSIDGLKFTRINIMSELTIGQFCHYCVYSFYNPIGQSWFLIYNPNVRPQRLRNMMCWFS